MAAAGGADPVSAIAQAVGAIADTITAFVGQGMQRVAYSKGAEVEAISIERQKELAAYQGIADNSRTLMYLIVGMTALILILIFIKKRNNNGI